MQRGGEEQMVGSLSGGVLSVVGLSVVAEVIQSQSGKMTV